MSASNTPGNAIDRLLHGLGQLREIKARQRKPKAPAVDVTVAVMSYNNAAFLGETIESVLAQEGVRLELVVFDDCSPDHSVQVLEGYRHDARFRYQINPRNLGMIGNYNQCLRAGSGRYVVVLGSDDILYPDHLRSLVQAMDRHPHASLGYTQCMWIDEHGKVLRHAVHPGHRAESYVGGRDELVDLLTHDSYITPSAAIFRRSILPSLTLPDGGVHRDGMLAGDWELWTRMAQVAPDFLFLHQATVGYRIHGGQISQNFYASDKPLAEHTRILELNLAEPAARKRMQRSADGIWKLYLRRMASYPTELQAHYAQRQEQIRRMLFDFTPGQALACEYLFSVIVTTFNRPKFLMDALASLASQSCKDFEVILVNDNGSPVENMLDGFEFPITYMRQSRNRGPAAARNAAHRLARGRFVTYLDDDDRYLPEHLQTLAQAIEVHPNQVPYADAIYIIESLEGEARVEQAREQRYRHGEYSKERLFVDNYIPINTFACPRELLELIGGFDESMHGLEDWDFLMRLASRATLRHVPGDTVEVRLREAKFDPTRRSQQAFKDYSRLYLDLYARHGDLGSETVRQGRRKMLQRLGVAESGQRHGIAMRQWLDQRQLTPIQQRLVEERLQQHACAPLFAIAVIDLQGDAAKVSATLASLHAAKALYPRIQSTLLSVAPDTAADFRGPVLPVTPDNWLETLNRLIAESNCDWMGLIHAGDELTAHGLLIVALELLTAPDTRALYCDGMYRHTDGSLGAALRPDFNLDYLLSLPTGMGRHWLFRRTEVLATGGFDKAYAHAPEFELILRLINSGGLEGLGHVAEPLLVTDSPSLQDVDDEKRAILCHLRDRGYVNAQVRSDRPGQYRLNYGHAQQPPVSVLIMAGSSLAHVQRCVESLLETTRYPNYELLLIDSAATADDVSQWLQAIGSLGEPRLRTIDPGLSGNSVTAMLQFATEQALGDYLLLLSPESAIIDGDWLDELLNHAQRPEVGVVGGKLLTPEGKIRHAGLLLGLEGPAGEAFAGEAMDSAGYMERLQVDQSYSAVSQHCLMIARELYQALGGLSPDVPERYLDIDLCLRVRQAGYLIVWAANARVMLGAQDPAPVPHEEQDALYRKWLPLIVRDPAYNRNLSLSQPGGFKLADSELSWRPLSSWRPLPTVLAHPATASSSGHARIIQPFCALQHAGLVEGALSLGLLQLTELARYAPDSIILHQRMDSERLEAMRRMKSLSTSFKVFDMDSLCDSLAAPSTQGDALKVLRNGLGFVDRFVVATPALAELFSNLHHDVQILENRLPVLWKAQQGLRRAGRKPRVGWNAADADPQMMAEVFQALAGEVEWVFIGDCPAGLRTFAHELHPQVAVEQYPTMLASLNLDLALAPLRQNLANDCQGNLVLLEFGACGIPVICSNVRAYQDDTLPVTRVDNEARTWVDAIHMHTGDLDASARLGDELQTVVHRDWMLEGHHLDAWQKAWLPG
ncbi:glycosyltransferase [Pseudomonas sp. HLMP]|uniref:glycosyltransferase n=1 Tax=Pseudomonas sp. HLMP TaxID=3153767 RepID=UPI0039670B07